MNVTVYEYSKCSTCRNAIKWLQAHHYEVKKIPIVEHPPSKEELRELIRLSGLEIRKFFNTSGEVYKQMGLKDKLGGMDMEEMLGLLSSNGKLIKRPIVTNGRTTTVGFKKPEFEQVWGASKA